MAYQVGGLIEASDYNGFVTTSTPNLNFIWSVGSGSSGYGQTAVPVVGVGQLIEASSWANLVSTIAKIAAHTGTTITPITVPAVGDLISYYNVLSSNLSAVNNGKLNAIATGTDITNSATRTASWGQAVGIASVTSTVTVTFPSGDAARYFFNAGGTIRLSFSVTGGSGTPQDLAWQQLGTDLGTLALPAVNSSQTIAGTAFQGFTKIGGGGATPDIYSRQGYYQLTALPQSLFRQFASAGVYSSDYIVVSAQASGATVTFTVQFVDNTGGGTPDLIDSDITVTATARPPSTSVIANTWGTPTVTVTAPA